MVGRFMLAIVLVFTLEVKAQTKTPNTVQPRVTAQWVESDQKGHKFVQIELKSSLNEKQEELINSGFSTFSQLLIYPPGANKKVDTPIFELTCTVKYDLWEEQYELARLDKKNPQAISVNSFLKYSTLCLTAEVDADLLEPFVGKSLTAELHLDQISAAKASEIKEWLVRQQSGVMRGIFSHMLGDLKLSESLRVIVDLPARNTH